MCSKMCEFHWQSLITKRRRGKEKASRNGDIVADRKKKGKKFAFKLKEHTKKKENGRIGRREQRERERARQIRCKVNANKESENGEKLAHK